MKHQRFYRFVPTNDLVYQLKRALFIAVYSRRGFFIRAGRVSWLNIFSDSSKRTQFWAINLPKPLTLSRTKYLVLHLLDNRVLCSTLYVFLAGLEGRMYVVQLDSRDSRSCAMPETRIVFCSESSFIMTNILSAQQKAESAGYMRQLVIAIHHNILLKGG